MHRLGGETRAVVAGGCAESIPSRRRRSFPSPGRPVHNPTQGASAQCQSDQGGTPFFPSPRRPLLNPGASVRCQSLQGARPLFTLSWGRGRFRRTRRKSVRGLPRTQARVTQSSLQGDLCLTRGTGVRCQSPQRDAPLHPLQGERRILASSPEEGEGSSGQPPSGYAKLSPRGEADAAVPGGNR